MNKKSPVVANVTPYGTQQSVIKISFLLLCLQRQSNILCCCIATLPQLNMVLFFSHSPKIQAWGFTIYCFDT